MWMMMMRMMMKEFLGKRGEEFVVILVSLFLLQPISADYIHEGCEIKQFTEKESILVTSEDFIHMVIARNGQNSVIEIKGESSNNVQLKLPDIFPQTLTPVTLNLSEPWKLEFKNEAKELKTLPFPETGNLTGQEKNVLLKNAFAVKYCTQDLLYMELTKEKIEKDFPVEHDRNFTFVIISTSNNKASVSFGEQKFFLCWNKTQQQIMAQKGDSRDCLNLPIVSPQFFSFFCNSTSQTIKINEQEFGDAKKLNGKVTFGLEGNENRVYVVYCLKGCPKNHANEPTTSDTPHDGTTEEIPTTSGTPCNGTAEKTPTTSGTPLMGSIREIGIIIMSTVLVLVLIAMVIKLYLQQNELRAKSKAAEMELDEEGYGDHNPIPAVEMEMHEDGDVVSNPRQSAEQIYKGEE